MIFLHLSVLLSLTAGLGADSSGEAPAPVIQLSSGQDFPAIGLGTWLGYSDKVNQQDLKGNEVQLSVEAAIDAGYRHVDTAAKYGTEEQVGRAINKKIAEGVIKREDIFVTTKLWNDAHDKEAVVPALRDSLHRLNLTYVDLYLIHWPVALNADKSLADIDYLSTWLGMEQTLDEGLARGIGVCNFNQMQLRRLVENSRVKPAVLQVEVNLNLQQAALRSYCRDHNITATGFTPFGSLFYSKAAADAPPPRVDDPALQAIATKYNKTVTQVNLRYLVELGVVPIPKSLTPSRIVENLQIFDFHLTAEELDQLKAFDKGYRTIALDRWSRSPYYPF